MSRHSPTISAALPSSKTIHQGKRCVFVCDDHIVPMIGCPFFLLKKSSLYATPLCSPTIPQSAAPVSFVGWRGEEDAIPNGVSRIFEAALQAASKILDTPFGMASLKRQEISLGTSCFPAPLMY